MSLVDALSHHSFIRSIFHYESLTSTNVVALERCASGELKDGDMIITDFQTEGKGRFQNKWHSRPGEDILMSLVLKPKCSINQISCLSFPLGIALHNALAHYIPAHVSIRLKWPNDILIDGKKCAGMLHAIEPSSGLVVIGVGVNVNQHIEMPDRTSLKMISGIQLNRTEVLNDILFVIGNHLEDIVTASISVDDWNQRAAYIGQNVQVVDQQIISGQFLGINQQGAALIRNQRSVSSVLTGHGFRLA